MSLIELLVVLAIMTIVGTSLISSFGRMTDQNKVAAGTMKLSAALHLARNLAIANKRVYHVWIDNLDYTEKNVEITPGVGGARVETDNPNYLKPLDQQNIRISYFSSLSRARSVTDRTTVQVAWSKGNIESIGSGTIKSSGKIVEGDYTEFTNQILPGFSIVAAGETKVVTEVNDAVLKVESAFTTDLPVGTTFKVIRDNGSVSIDTLPPNVYVGVQYADNATKFHRVLFFNPDGSASQPMTFFLTDNATLADTPPPPLSPADLPFMQLQVDRINVNLQNRDKSLNNADKIKGTVRMIQVYRGGMIKEIKRYVHDSGIGTNDPN